MPKPRRNSAGGSKAKRRRIIAKKPNWTFDGRTARLSKKGFEQLRSDPDFINLIRIGRSINALSFAFEVATPIIKTGTKKPTQRRDFYRALYLLAGYTHETLLLFHSLRGSYQTEDFFAPAFAVAYPADKTRAKIIEKIRNATGFHLESASHQRFTDLTLGNIELPYYPIWSGLGDGLVDGYFEFADFVDLTYLIDTFKGDRVEGKKRHEIVEVENQILKEIQLTIAELAGEVLGAADAILRGLINRLLHREVPINEEETG